MRDLLIRSAERSDVEELVRLRLLFQHHMERSNPRDWRITKEGEAHLREELRRCSRRRMGGCWWR